VAANSGGDKTKYFCISCGGVTFSATKEEAEEERRHGHHLEVFSPIAPEVGVSPAGGPSRTGESSDGKGTEQKDPGVQSTAEMGGAR